MVGPSKFAEFHSHRIGDELLAEVVVDPEAVLDLELAPALVGYPEHMWHGRSRKESLALVEVSMIRLNFIRKRFIFRNIFEKLKCWCCFHLP